MTSHQTTMSTKWVYLTDLAPSAIIKNLDTGETRSIMSNAVKDRAPSGLRRTVLVSDANGLFRETDEVLPLTVELAEEIEEYYTLPNNWNYDWPHLPTEVEDTPEMRQALTETLRNQLGDVPFEFQVTGMQRRFLLYFSDGNMESQQRFDRLIPSPGMSPFNRKWELRPRYEMYYNSIMRDAKVPFPKDKQKWGPGRPCLYVGPAWTLRFRIDGQDPLLERCRVYVMDDGTFIGSDWCQRHDFSSYGGGINLQMGIYTLGSWIMGPCLTYNKQHDGIKLKNSVYKVEQVRELVKKAPVAVPKFEESFSKAQALIQQYAPQVAKPAVVEVGPITKDVMLEATATFEQLLADIEANREARSTEAPVRSTPLVKITKCLAESQGLRLYKVATPNDSDHDWMFMAYYYDSERDLVGVRPVAGTQEDAIAAIGGVELFEAFSVDTYNRSSTGFWYRGVTGGIDDNDDIVETGEDELSDHWWLFDAACYYRDEIKDELVLNPIARVILETT